MSGQEIGAVYGAAKVNTENLTTKLEDAQRATSEHLQRVAYDSPGPRVEGPTLIDRVYQLQDELNILRQTLDKFAQITDERLRKLEGVVGI